MRDLSSSAFIIPTHSISIYLQKTFTVHAVLHLILIFTIFFCNGKFTHAIKCPHQVMISIISVHSNWNSYCVHVWTQHYRGRKMSKWKKPHKNKNLWRHFQCKIAFGLIALNKQTNRFSLAKVNREREKEKKVASAHISFTVNTDNKENSSNSNEKKRVQLN